MARGIRQTLTGITFFLLLTLFVATLGSLQFGFHLSELNAPEDVITCRKKSIGTGSADLSASRVGLPDCIEMSSAWFATVSSIYTLGGLLGALSAGALSSIYGRRPTMGMTAVSYVLGSAIETGSPSVWSLIIGRLFSGIGAGASTVIVPIYISEIAPPKDKGLFGFLTQISINVGILVTQTEGYFLSYGGKWRYILFTGLVIAVAQGIGLIFIPESPSWLAAHGKATEAERSLRRLRGEKGDIHDEIAGWVSKSDSSAPEEEGLLAGSAEDTPEPRNLSAGSGQTDKPKHSGFVQVWRDPETRPAIVAVVGIMVAQQFCGINSVIMYSVSLLDDLLPVSSALLTILISVVNLLTTIACSPLPDLLGRKTCLLISILGQGSSALILAISIVSGTKVFSAISVLAFVAFFAVGLGPVPFMMASELVDQAAVGATQSWCLAANYVATFVVAQFFPIVNKALNNALGGKGWVYFIFTALAALSAVFVWLRVPETKGKKDADEVWGRVRRLD